jgi:NAD+ synthase
MLGYFTKHGDIACDFLPLASLYKNQVRELARELGLPESIIQKEPSAGFWPGQTDEGEIGTSYEEMDSELQKGGGKLAERIKKTEHKRKGPDTI